MALSLHNCTQLAVQPPNVVMQTDKDVAIRRLLLVGGVRFL